VPEAKKAEPKNHEKTDEAKPPKPPAAAPGRVGDGSLTPHSQQQQKPPAAHLKQKGMSGDSSKHTDYEVAGITKKTDEKVASDQKNHQHRIYHKDEKDEHGEKEVHPPCDAVPLSQRAKCEEERKTREKDKKSLGTVR